MPEAEYRRCRLCLVAAPSLDPARLAAALSGGDVASVIIAAAGADTESFQRAAEVLVPIAQGRGAAVLIENDTRVAGRVGADGVHVSGGPAELAAAIASLRPKKIVGAGNLRARHEAMVAGEANPDYVFFGRLDGDTSDAIFDKALDLAEWWAPTFLVPAILMGGKSLASVREAAATGVEFVALSRAVFDADDPAAAVAEANRLLSTVGEPA